MAVYFGGDNIVWASQAGILSNKGLVAKAQKASLYGWAGGSVCTVINELYELQGEHLTVFLKKEGGSRASGGVRGAELKLVLWGCPGWT